MSKTEITVSNKGGYKASLIIMALALIAGAILAVWYFNSVNNKWLELQSIQSNNFKADLAAKDGLIRVYKTKIDDLKESSDNLDKIIVQRAKEAKMKDKKISSLYYMVDSLSTVDTFIIEKPIFLPAVDIDTLLVKEGYNLRLQLKAPSTIITTPSFVNEKLVGFNQKKETIEKRKKWPMYWFQKKHTIVEVIVTDSNPFCTSGPQRFYEIVK